MSLFQTLLRLVQDLTDLARFVIAASGLQLSRSLPGALIASGKTAT